MYSANSLDSKQDKHSFNRERDCTKTFCEDLKKYALEIINFKEKDMIPWTDKEIIYYEKQKLCHISKKEFCYDKNKKINLNCIKKLEIIVIIKENL